MSEVSPPNQARTPADRRSSVSSTSSWRQVIAGPRAVEGEKFPSKHAYFDITPHKPARSQKTHPPCFSVPPLDCRGCRKIVAICLEWLREWSDQQLPLQATKERDGSVVVVLQRGVDDRLCDRHLKLGIIAPPFVELVAVTSVQIFLCRYILRKIEKENLKDKEGSTWCESP